MDKKILIVEDDGNIRDLLRLYLEREGYIVTSEADGEAGLNRFKKDEFSLVLLDIMMPRMDGIELCRKIREISDVPLIMLTAKSETFDKVMALDLGADDYIVKPFEMREVLARINAVIRRSDKGGDKKKLIFDNLIIDKEAYELIVKGKKVSAPPKEIELLFFLANGANRVFTRSQLLDNVWGFNYFGDTRTVDVHVKRLREKLDGASPEWSLNTVWGVGYKFELKDGAHEEQK